MSCELPAVMTGSTVQCSSTEEHEEEKEIKVLRRVEWRRSYASSNFNVCRMRMRHWLCGTGHSQNNSLGDQKKTQPPKDFRRTVHVSRVNDQW